MNPETAAMLEQQQDAHQIKYLIPDLPVQMYGRVQKEPPSWGLDRIDQRTDDLDGMYHYPSSAGQNVTIYVIDTGVNIDHRDFGGRAFHGPIFLPGATDPLDKNGHGTFVAALAAGSTYGVAKKAQIVSLKALDDAGAGRLSNVLAAIEWVVKRHLAQGPSTRSIINLSLGAEHNDPTNAAIQEAMRLGVHFAIAAGNDAKDACQFSPASTPGAMTVGATDQDDTIASYSNYGPCVAIYAPGSNIISAWSGSDDARHVQSGTSMASPHVAGLMALWMSENPGQVISVSNMTERILESMTKFALNGRLVSDVMSYPAKLVSPSSSSSSLPTLGRVLQEENVEPTPEDSRRLGGLQRIQDFHGKALARNLVFVGAVAPVHTGEIEEEDTPVESGSWTKQPSAGVSLLAMSVWSVIHFMV
ncbi:hypothetical protein BGZ81_008010 [Podila clonocystis]|nr:hypothetical protein BGZ81_008010 [Podila clonocystis]